MNIRNRLRPSSSVISLYNSVENNTGSDSDGRVVTGIQLSCDDMSDDGEVRREYKITRGVHRTVDFVRATVVNPSGHITIAAGGAAHVTFSSPVMSRRHARITFAEDGSVTVMDVGSMHGTYLEGIDFRDFLPEKMKPRRHYTLRSGDTLLLGKTVTRAGQNWKPVAVRVTFMHDGEARHASPPPNRYGLYLLSAGTSEPDLHDDDTDSIASSSGEEDNASQGTSESSPDTSPLANHAPLSLSAAASASASFENVSGINRSADNASPSASVFDLARTGSARSTLRAMLPPMPTFQLPDIRRLPSLRELGFFTNGGAHASMNEVTVDDESASISRCDAEEADTTIHVVTTVERRESSQDPYQDARLSVISPQPSSAQEDGDAASIFTWQEPSHPQNQLGLEFNEDDDLYKSRGVETTGNGGFSYNKPESGDFNVGGDEEKKHQHDDEKSMDISPCSSRGASPFSSRQEVTDVAHVDGLHIGPAEPEEEQVCRCHEVEAQENCGQEELQVKSAGNAPATPGPQTASFNFTSAPAADEEAERRRARAARFGLSLNPVPPSPVSISKRGKRVGARVGPAHRPSRQSDPHVDKRAASNRAPDLDLLRARVRSLEARMKHVREGAVMTGVYNSSSVTPSASVTATSVDEARKEMESMRQEMRRLSGLLETLVAKMEVQTAKAIHRERGVQADELQSKMAGDVSGVETLLTDRKRKRAEDICNLGDYEADRILFGMSSHLHRPMMENIRALHEPVEQPEIRPVKRARTGAKDAVVTVAAAAGYTGLGAALAWAALAYVL